VRNVSTQRNVGAAKARGQWLLFLDADSRISLHFLKKLSFGLQQKDPDVFTCLLRVHSTKKEELALAKIVNYATLIYSKFRPISMGACMGAKKEVWKLLRFDESLKVMEDYDFSIRAVKKGLSFVVFQQPKYVYSLRRMRKVGITQHALMSVISVINSATDGLLFNELP
jgi:glycosyltransferase involved in cell wall biosynthesis